MKNFFSKSGIILGVVLTLVSIVLSSVAYNDSQIRHPEGYSDLKALAYPNILLGLPAQLLISQPIINPLVQSYYRPPAGVPISNEAISQIYATNLFVTLFLVLTLYWFIVGLIFMWVYKKLPKVFQIILIIIAVVVVFSTVYISISTTTPRPYNPQTELDKMIQGKKQVPCLGSNPPGAVCYE